MRNKILLFFIICTVVFLPNSLAFGIQEENTLPGSGILEIKPGEAYEIIGKEGLTEVYFYGESGTEGIEASWSNFHYSSIAINNTFNFPLRENDNGIIRNTGNVTHKINLKYENNPEIMKTNKLTYEKIILKKNQTLHYNAIDKKNLYMACNIGGEDKVQYDTVLYFDYTHPAALEKTINIIRSDFTVGSHLMQGLDRVKFSNTKDKDLVVYINHSKRYEYEILDESALEEVKLYRGDSYELNPSRKIYIDNKVEESSDYRYQYLSYDIGGWRGGVRSEESISFSNYFDITESFANVSRRYDVFLIPVEYKSMLNKIERPLFVNRRIASEGGLYLKNFTEKDLVIFNVNSNSDTPQFIVQPDQEINLKGIGNEYLIQWELLYGDKNIESEDISIDGYVDIVDLSLLALSYGEKEGSYYYNPNEDIVLDGIIDIYDLVGVSKRI
ncbi:MAG: hypothetical protein ACRC7N_13440 [Clostridium sp.]